MVFDAVTSLIALMPASRAITTCSACAGIGVPTITASSFGSTAIISA